MLEILDLCTGVAGQGLMGNIQSGVIGKANRMEERRYRSSEKES